MDNDPIEMQARTNSRRSLHVLDKSSNGDELGSNRSGTWNKIWLGVAAIALLLSCVIAFVVNNKRATIIQQPSPEQKRINSRRATLLTDADGPNRVSGWARLVCKSCTWKEYGSRRLDW